MDAPTRTAPTSVAATAPAGSPRRLLCAVAGAAAPGLVVLSSVLFPALPDDARLAVPEIAAAADRWLGVHLLYAVASLLLLPFVVTLWQPAAGRGAALRTVGGLLTIVGAASNALSQGAWGYLFWSAAQAGVPVDAQVQMSAAIDGSAWGLPVSFLAVPVLVLGLLLLLAGVARAGRDPLWLPVGAVAGLLASVVAGVGPAALVGLPLAVCGAVLVWRSAGR